MSKEIIYDEQINELIAQIIKMCKDHKIAMFATFILDHDEDTDDDALCCTTALRGSVCQDDNEKINELIKIMKNNYDAVPKTFTVTIEDD